MLRAFRDFGAANLLQAGIAREDTGGEWAPFVGFPGCVDREGRVRAVHFHDADGRCVYCQHVLIEAEAL